MRNRLRETTRNGAPTAAPRANYERIARFYDLVDLPFEYARYRHLRPLLFEGLGGRILDAGVGTGRNMPYHPPGSEVVGIDNSPAMLRIAGKRCAQSPALVRLREMDVTRLDFPDASFDGAVASFLFCTLPEELQAPALRELSRVLKPGGILRLLDYRRPSGGFRLLLTKLWEPWAKWAFGASFDRHPERYFAQTGLTMSRKRFLVDDLITLVEATHQRGQDARSTAPVLSGATESSCGSEGVLQR